jgi:uncharacterized protein (TIGR02217 family)
MLDFVESPRFDETISYGSTGGPGFKTFIFEGDSGIEGSVQNWEVVKGRWNLEKAINDKSDFDVVRAFFYNMRGKARGFRFKDHFDYIATDEPCSGLVNGVNRDFKLVKRYTSGSLSFDRRIFKPINGTLSMKVDGSAAGVTSVDYTTGDVRLAAAPTIGQVVTASFQFDVPVRFDVDELLASYEGFQLQTWSGIALVELILED